MSKKITTPVSTTGTTSDTLFFKLLVRIKDTLKEVYSFTESDLSSMVVTGTMMPLVTEVMRHPVMMDAILANIIDDDIIKSIEKLDSFLLVRDVKKGLGKTMFSNTQQYSYSSTRL